MPEIYERDLDLNLLRVFLVVADAGSVTVAASQLYVTQPAVSAALRRLTQAIGAPLLARAGRGLVLTARGERLRAAARPHLQALLDAARAPAGFDPGTTTRTVRLGLSDASEGWLLAPMLQRLAQTAPGMRVIVVPIQFRTVGAALARGDVDMALTVADELPASVERQPLFTSTFACLFDPRHARIGRTLTVARYLAHAHVIVSYNGDLRGVIEDVHGVTRRAVVAVPSFASVGALVDGGALLATLPTLVATSIRQTRRHLHSVPLPRELALTGNPMELLWPRATTDDDALAWMRAQVTAQALSAHRALRPRA